MSCSNDDYRMPRYVISNELALHVNRCKQAIARFDLPMSVTAIFRQSTSGKAALKTEF